MADQELPIFDRLERFYDSVPRYQATAESIGSMVLFVRNGPGMPLYARPDPAAGRSPTAAELESVLVRQRELGLPEAVEWVHENTPQLLRTAREAGLSVLCAPLMVMEPAGVQWAGLSEFEIRLVDPGASSFAADLATQRAVAAVAFAGHGADEDPADPEQSADPEESDGSALRAAAQLAGPAERDAALVAVAEEDLASVRQRVEAGRLLLALAESKGDGAVGSGMVQRVDDVAEVVGVATLPFARRRGGASALTCALAEAALAAGARVVFLSAGSDEAARVYQRVGFRRIGTACIAEAG